MSMPPLSRGWSGFGGAVHIDDVAQAVVCSLDRLATAAEVPPVALVVDGAYEYTAADLVAWDAEGTGSHVQTVLCPV